MKGRITENFKKILADNEARNKLLRAVSRDESTETITVKGNPDNKNMRDNSQVTYKVTISESINLPKSNKLDSASQDSEK